MANVRLPDNVHKLKGTYRKHRHGDPGEKPEWDEGPPNIPPAVAENPLALEEWQRALRDAPPGVINKTNRAVLAQFALMAARFYADPDSFNASDHTQLRLIQQELGFTPLSRGKIIGKPTDDKGDDFE